jgi:hypothetical protein
MPRPPSPDPPRAPVALIAVAALGALLAGCAPPARTSGPVAATLFVGDGAAGTVTPLESGSGRPVGPPVPVGAAPEQILTGPAGYLLVLTTPAAPASGPATLTQVGFQDQRWQSRPIALGTPAYDATLAGDGGRYAVVAFHPAPAPPAAGDGARPPGSPCRVAIVDVLGGVVERTLTVCDAGERVTAAALESGTAGSVVYLGIWSAAEDGDPSGGARGRLVALDARSGAVRAAVPADGRPGYLSLAPVRSPRLDRLYCVEDVTYPAYNTSSGVRRRIVVRDPATLQPERDLPLRDAPLRVAVAPDGQRAYALTAGGRQLASVDLASGVEAPPVSLPGPGFALAVSEAWVYISHPASGAVWVTDRKRGAVVKAIGIGPQPTEVALGGQI